jgi:hypothetical protein
MKRNVPLLPGKPLQRKTLLKSAAFNRLAAREHKTVSKLKSRGPKMTPIRRAARGQDCQLQILGVCNGDPGTTVLCHSNRLADGKGMGLKAPDTAACFGCHSCHSVLDGRAPRPDGMSMDDLLELFAYARERTHAILRAKGLLKEASPC